MLNSIFDQVKAWHSACFARPWLGPLENTRTKTLAVLTLALVAVFANVKVRYDQGQIWEANPNITEIAGAMSFSTADAPFFLGHAAIAEKKLPPEEYNRKRSYPTRATITKPSNWDESTDKRPLLSSLISLISPSAKPKDLLDAGHFVLLVSSGLTAGMLILAFGATGYWLEGTVAAIGGGLSSAYMVRSAFGRIDTDQLNLGLMYLVFGLVMYSARSKTAFQTLTWAILAGTSARIFTAWYGKPEMIWMAILSYAWLLIALQKDKRLAFICIVVFYLLSNVTLPKTFGSIYLLDRITVGGFFFPNTISTISETATVSISDVLVMATGSIEMGLVCIVGLALWALRHPVIAFAYGPLATFALLNFVIGNRAVFYSTPMLWFGVAFLLTSVFRLCTHFICSNAEKNLYSAPMKLASSIVGATLAISIAWVNSPTNYLPRPSFPKPILHGFIDLASIAQNDRSVVATWWDYGYASQFLNNIPTLHDGGSQTGPVTHLFAKALLSQKQTDTIKTLRFIASQGNEGIGNFDSKKSLFGAINQPIKHSIPDIYLVLTSQMEGWIGSISKLANWDIEVGQPVVPPDNRGVAHFEYFKLQCNYQKFPEEMTCGNVHLDIVKGLMNDAPAIVGWTRARNGFANDVRRYNEGATFGVQSLHTNYRLSSKLMHRHLYDSSFNKLYHLGLIEAPGITLVYDNYPHIRIYKIAGTD